MVEINLLPWREYLQEKRKKIFRISFIIVVVSILFFYAFYPFREKPPVINPIIIPVKIQAVKRDIPIKQDIFNTPLRQLKMAGYLLQGDIKWALIKLPNGKTVVVHEGDVLGKEKATVLTVKEGRLELTDSRSISANA